MDPESSRESWWSLYLIERPTWFSESFDHFRNAVTFAVAGNDTEALEALDATRSKEIQEWFHEKAQKATRFSEGLAPRASLNSNGNGHS